MRRIFTLVLSVATLLLTSHEVRAEEMRGDLMVGKWRIRQDKSLVETFEFSKGGKGRISKTTEKESTQGTISWSIEAIYGNACILKIVYEGAPANVPPLVLLLAFDGTDTAVFQPRTDRIMFMDRQKPNDPRP